MSGEKFEWFYVGSSGQVGPLSETQILDLADHAVITRDTLVWRAGMASWVPASQLPKIAARFQPTFTPPQTPVPPPVPNQTRPVSSSASKSCPLDRTPLRHELRSGVEIDWCPTCKGVWLDRGELDKLMERESSYRDDDDYKSHQHYPKHKRKRGFMHEVFDIFD